MITIGQLAAYAGVTIKAVRHYHERGLLEEPERDASGYRRYGAEHAIALVKIRTLAERRAARPHPGAARGRSGAAPAGGSPRSTGAWSASSWELQRARERIGRLGSGDRLFVSAEVAGLLESLLELGVSERTVHMERDI
ncbi:hypothetical protein GCM10020218_105880 [Dactylosporangium vinaceum]